MHYFHDSEAMALKKKKVAKESESVVEAKDAVGKLDGPVVASVSGVKNGKKKKRKVSAELPVETSAGMPVVHDKEGKKRKMDPPKEMPQDAASEEAAARAAREEATRDKKNAIEKKKAQNRDLRERYEEDPTSLTIEERVRAKALVRVFELTEAARAKLAPRTPGQEGNFTVDGDDFKGSNESRRQKQGEIAESRREKKMAARESTAAPSEAGESGRVGAGGRGGASGRGSSGFTGQGRGGSGKGTSEGGAEPPSSAQTAGRGRGSSGRGAGGGRTASSSGAAPGFTGRGRGGR